jgi:hypothetical protein
LVSGLTRRTSLLCREVLRHHLLLVLVLLLLVGNLVHIHSSYAWIPLHELGRECRVGLRRYPTIIEHGYLLHSLLLLPLYLLRGKMCH